MNRAQISGAIIQIMIVQVQMHSMKIIHDFDNTQFSKFIMIKVSAIRMIAANLAVSKIEIDTI